MSMYSLLRSKPEAPTEADIEETLAGNLWYHTPACVLPLYLYTVEPFFTSGISAVPRKLGMCPCWTSLSEAD